MRALAVLLLALALQGCAGVRPLPPAADLKPGAGEVVVIGKIELVPPIDPRYEQRTHWNVIGDKRLLRSVWIATGAEPRTLRQEAPKAADFDGSLEAEWGVPFMVKAPRQRTFLHGGMALLDAARQERLWFPGGFYFDVPPGVSAVYIGTLRYHRNDFNVITRVEVVNERGDLAAVLPAGASGAQVWTSLLQRLR